MKKELREEKEKSAKEMQERVNLAEENKKLKKETQETFAVVMKNIEDTKKNLEKSLKLQE